MTVATCPECKDEVSVPAGVSAEAQVKCPLCGVEFAMARITKQLPPSLIVLGESKGSGGGTAGGFPIQINQGGRPADKPFEAAPASSFSFEEKSAPPGPKPTYATDGGKAETTPTRSTARATARPAGGKNQKNMVFEVMKVIIGGLAAFPVVQLAVWWVGRSDPLDLGPKIGAVIPFVVPKHLRSPQAENNSAAENSSAENRKTLDDRKALDDINDQKATQNVTSGSFKSSGANKAGKGLASNPDFEAVPTVSNSRPKLSPEDLIDEKEAGNTALKTVALGGKGSTPAEVNEAITELRNVPPMVAGESNAEIQDRHFQALCSLAEKLAILKGDATEVEDAKAAAEQAVSQDFPRPLQQATSLRAKQLWDEAPENHTGIAICGKLSKVETRDTFYLVEIKWAHQPSETIKIYSKDAGMLNLAADANLVALGTVVDGPSHQLPEGQYILAALVAPLN